MSLSDIPRIFYYNNELDIFKFLDKTELCEGTNSETWQADIKLRPYNSILTIQATISPNRKLWKSEYNIDKKLVSLLKSNLQKCVRRQETDKAIRTATALLNYKPVELLRRLPQIMIEDTLPWPDGYMKLIWFMCATSKGYLLNISEVETILGIVSTMCESKIFEPFNSIIGFEPVHIWETLENKHRDFMWCLELRKLFLGMSIDVVMNSYHQGLWSQRFNEDKTYWNKLQEQDEYEIDLKSIGNFSTDDILIESVDYHVYSWILGKIQNKFPEFSQRQIKGAIWFCSSRINKRQPITEENYREVPEGLEDVWINIEKDVRGLSRWILEKLVT